MCCVYLIKSDVLDEIVPYCNVNTNNHFNIFEDQNVNSNNFMSIYNIYTCRYSKYFNELLVFLNMYNEQFEIIVLLCVIRRLEVLGATSVKICISLAR